MTISRPASARRMAVAAPIPRAPPVMRAARRSTGAAKRRSGMVLQDGDAQLGGQAAEEGDDRGQVFGDGALGQDWVFGRQGFHAGEHGAEVEMAFAGAAVLDVDGQLVLQPDVLGMATDDMAAEDVEVMVDGGSGVVDFL